MDESEIYGAFGKLVRQHRKRLSMNQEALGGEIGLSRASIANIETGRQHIPLHHLYRLARALKVDPHTLLPSTAIDRTVSADREITSSMDLSDRQQAAVAQVVGSIGVAARRGAE
jgi:transcriptional regulator with XRE-family HTH domain